LAADDPVSGARLAAFLQGLQELGWTDGRNVQIDTRWAAGDAGRFRQYAAELVALAPDVILASTSPSVAALQQASRIVPIVFANVTDPVGQGFVASLARPGGNATGFSIYEYGIGPKWLELLREITPGVTRVAVLSDPALASTSGLLGAFQGGANGGLVVLGTPLTAVHRELIITLAARHRLPAVYTLRFFVTSGGLVSYGPNVLDEYLRAAGYVDRILKGEKPADLPVQAPTKYELVINLKTAKALGLEVPPTLLARADEVIE
jgi:putative ABC transport system substrate-binding protein